MFKNTIHNTVANLFYYSTKSSNLDRTAERILLYHSLDVSHRISIRRLREYQIHDTITTPNRHKKKPVHIFLAIFDSLFHCSAINKHRLVVREHRPEEKSNQFERAPCSGGRRSRDGGHRVRAGDLHTRIHRQSASSAIPLRFGESKVFVASWLPIQFPFPFILWSRIVTARKWAWRRTRGRSSSSWTSPPNGINPS
jgi:hypothetical protein